ncbi:hypothetical protein B0T20DRAFT_116526 [Sordaria brevicollis]|uniref:Uncharacterized protein n=1 Tax=Sordaria brevicollis TaxID=83679 RepID=A0AAE0PKH5_SORBR|nr:hypothetical protein B0T20DRAFT_116526 [Sordaria brevicollis]
MSEQQPAQNAYAQNSKLVKYDCNRPQRRHHEMIRITGPTSHKKAEEKNVENVLEKLPPFPMGKFSWTSEELNVPDNPTDDDRDVMLVIGEVLPHHVVTSHQAQENPKGVIPCVPSARPLVTPVRGINRNLFVLTTRDSTSHRYQVQIYGAKDNWDNIFFYPENAIHVDTKQYRSRFDAWKKNITNFLVKNDRGQATNAIPLASKGVKPPLPPPTSLPGYNDHYVASKCIKALYLHKMTGIKEWLRVAKEAASDKIGHLEQATTNLFDELCLIDKLFHGKDAFSLEDAAATSMACQVVWFQQALEEDVKVFNPRHLLNLAGCLRAEQPVLLDRDILPPLYRTLLVVFCTLADDGRQDWPEMLTTAYNCARWCRPHDRDSNIFTSDILTVKVAEPQTALLGYIREEAGCTGMLIQAIREILDQDERELQSLKPLWHVEAADPSPNAALARFANASDPDEANLATHELALTYMARAHILVRQVVAALEAKKSSDDRVIEALLRG